MEQDEFVNLTSWVFMFLLFIVMFFFGFTGGAIFVMLAIIRLFLLGV